MAMAKNGSDEKTIKLDTIQDQSEIKRLADAKKVKGIFRFLELPGGKLEFVFRGYKKDKLQTYSLVDGETYTIPLGVARHLNQNCFYNEYKNVKNGDGTSSIARDKKVHRCSFQSLEFSDIS